MTVYVWHNEQVLTLPDLECEDFTYDGQHHHLTDKFMVDSRESKPSNRYGYMSNEFGYSEWESIPKAMFPKEFLTYLLLLEIS